MTSPDREGIPDPPVAKEITPQSPPPDVEGFGSPGPEVNPLWSPGVKINGQTENPNAGPPKAEYEDFDVKIRIKWWFPQEFVITLKSDRPKNRGPEFWSFPNTLPFMSKVKDVWNMEKVFAVARDSEAGKGIKSNHLDGIEIDAMGVQAVFVNYNSSKGYKTDQYWDSMTGTILFNEYMKNHDTRSPIVITLILGPPNKLRFQKKHKLPHPLRTITGRPSDHYELV